jgi:hypothetical protein
LSTALWTLIAALCMVVSIAPLPGKSEGLVRVAISMTFSRLIINAI